MKEFLTQFFTWWNGQTLGTRFHTWRHGELVGKDEQGNTYYRRKGIDKNLGFERRWVIYNGEAEASKVPPGWFGWLHNIVATTPDHENKKPKNWELPHKPNMTGTAFAYKPEGATKMGKKLKTTKRDYVAWSPDTKTK